jgi:chaperone modulatory protein CbpM
MMSIDEILGDITILRREDLLEWIEQELVQPEPEGDELGFSTVECQRIRLICSLRYELDIDADSLPVVLSLMDQLHRTRWYLSELARAVTDQDDPVKSAIIATLRSRHI